MTVKASITIDGVAALKPEQVRAAGRAALRKVGRKWIDTMLPIHFTNVAFSRYGYTKRDPGYRFRKRTRGNNGQSTAIGEDKPLVWSGQSRTSAKQARFQLENGTAGTVAGSVIINAPALNLRYAGSTIDMRDEVTRVTQAEVEELASLFVTEFERELNLAGKRARRRLAA